jgi:hypothetical protein
MATESPTYICGETHSALITFELSLDSLPVLHGHKIVFTAPVHNNRSYLIVACVFMAAGMCLLGRSLAMDVLLLLSACIAEHMFTKLFPNNGSTCHNNLKLNNFDLNVFFFF